MGEYGPLIGFLAFIFFVSLSAAGKWRGIYDEFRTLTTPQKKSETGVKHTNRRRPPKQEESFAFEAVESETKTTASHTQMMREMFTQIVTILQRTSLEERSLSIFDLDLIEKLTSMTPARIQEMRRSEITINSDKLRRLYQNNPDLPNRTLDSIGVYLADLDALLEQESQVQHMGHLEELVVEAVRSAAKIQQDTKKVTKRSKWQEAVVTSEILQRPKGIR